MFSLTEVSFSTGLLVGPLLCGSLADAVGFYWTSCALGEFTGGRDSMRMSCANHAVLAASSVVVAITSFAFFAHTTRELEESSGS